MVIQYVIVTTTNNIEQRSEPCCSGHPQYGGPRHVCQPYVANPVTTPFAERAYPLLYIGAPYYI